ncbi:MAG TPA: hypothetical protein VHG28_04495 [Longimicrobiaceae bacterium]|nr:hypothetical protein [Longimicrobiaceae bacterium]
MKWTGIPGMALALPLALHACTQPDRRVDITKTDDSTQAQEIDRELDQRAMSEASKTPSQEGDAGQVAPPRPTLATGQTAAGALAPLNNSGVGGTTTITAAGNGTAILISVTGVRQAPTLKVTLNRGDCSEPGGQVAELRKTLQVGGNGMASVTDTLQVPASVVMNGQHVLVVKPGNAGPTTPGVACAAIPANAGSPS